MSNHGSGAERMTDRNPSRPFRLPSATPLSSRGTREEEDRHLAARRQTREKVLREREAWAHDMVEPHQKADYRRAYDKPDGLDHVRRQQELQIATERNRDRERDVYRLERDPRDRPPDPWYRHPSHDQPRANPRQNISPLTANRQPSTDHHGPANMPRLSRYDRDREDWERERKRAYLDEEHSRMLDPRSHRRDESEYQRSLTDPRALPPVGGFSSGPSGALPPHRGTVSPVAYATTLRQASHDYHRELEEHNSSGYPYYPSPAASHRPHGAPGYLARSLEYRDMRMGGPHGMEDRSLDPHYPATEYHRVPSHGYVPSTSPRGDVMRNNLSGAGFEHEGRDAGPREMQQREQKEAIEQQRRMTRPSIDARTNVGMTVSPVASHSTAARLARTPSVSAFAVPVSGSSNGDEQGRETRQIREVANGIPTSAGSIGQSYPPMLPPHDLAYAATYEGPKYYAGPPSQPPHSSDYLRDVAAREAREALKYRIWQDEKRARLEELMNLERNKRNRAALRQGMAGTGQMDALPLSSRNGGDHLAPDSAAGSRSHTPVAEGAVGDLRRQLKAQHKATARARKERKEEALAAAAVAARQRTSDVHGSRRVSPSGVDDLDDELMDLVGEDGGDYPSNTPVAPGSAHDDERHSNDPNSASKRARRKDRLKIMDETELPQEHWPTKGTRNKDGSFRKKPGPPKGVKKSAGPGKTGLAGGSTGDAFGPAVEEIPAGSEHIRYGASIRDELLGAAAAPPASSKRRKLNGIVKVEIERGTDRLSSPYEELSSIRPEIPDSESASRFGERSPTDVGGRPESTSVYKGNDPLARSLSTIEQSRRLLQDLNSKSESYEPEIQMRSKKTGKKARDGDGDASHFNTESPQARSPESRDFQGGMPVNSDISPHASLAHDRARQGDVQERPWEQPLQVQASFVPHPQSRHEMLSPSQPQIVSLAGDQPFTRRPTPPEPTFEDIYGVDEADEMSPPPEVPINNAVARRRHLTVEAMQALIWQDLACNQIPTVARYVGQVIAARQDNARKVADAIARHVKKVQVKPPPTNNAIRQKARAAAKAATIHWKKAEREEVELRKKAEREVLERSRVEEAERERQRAAKRLQFLLDSGETYSKLMMKKIKTDEAMEEGDITVNADGKHTSGDSDDGADEADDVEYDLDAPDDPDLSEEELKKRAVARARAIMARKQREAAAFDDQVAGERSRAANVTVSTAALDFQNPLGAGVGVMVTQPVMLQAQLKDYQMRGLSWLAHLYESGINGILADEMGLGKTIQSISLLAWLAETHNIWGPFLVVAPTSTVHNWQAELTRFAPRLKVLPHWGTPADREVIRREWTRPAVTFTEDAPFHIVVTSYDMVNVDTQYFKKVRWQYMILDEAQAVKNAGTQRWTNLLSLKSRNRLLLTGTPIQNNMGELWALLHFIMPDLFTSLQDFTQWFSRGIEDGTGRKNDMLQAQQLRRLHDVLRPFMLRRVKRNVQSELGEKIEKDILVNLSPRQHMMYKALRSNASIKAILDQAKETSDTSTKRNALMNVVMQFRKVCNHPELFERADVTAPLSFSTFSSSGDLLREQSLYLPDSCENPICVQLPRILWEDGGILRRPSEQGRAGFETRYLQNLMNIWSPDNVVASFKDSDSAFSFLALTKDSISDLSRKAREPAIVQLMRSDLEALRQCESALDLPPASPFSIQAKLRKRLVLDHAVSPNEITLHNWKRSYLSRTEARFTLEEVVAPPIRAECSSRSFYVQQQNLKHPLLDKLALYGLPPILADDPAIVARAQKSLPNLPPFGLLRNSSSDQQPVTAMQFPSMKRLIFDSAKMARLDSLLRELKAGGHRVLIYFQMTKMMSIFEEYLIYRQLRYLRLDGGTAIADRRDMVNAWQSNPDIFIFMLSTRAGGLGINLTAADTVIFYEHDWNPSNDAQAMDRAHRVGQTRQVTVYRLICRGTVDERMLHLARNKKDVQDIVVGNKSLDEINAQKEIAALLLDDDDDSNDVPATFGNRSAGFGSTFATSTLPVDPDDEDGFFSNKKTGDDDDDDGSAAKSKKKVKRKTEGEEAGDNTAKPSKKRAPRPPADGDAPRPKKTKNSNAKSVPASELPSQFGTPEQPSEVRAL
ncbi:hypothetical protein QFC21_003610 [Naganishia friedmannii]|uniref:Uncharacterized protein n=1 Tax=Naganishia friedmannii TaxID=89922 RepID=A0ACC2VN84_9TREE|nr:hypothetical protein QFC21_003610 [Naganishia friedmannii]